MHCLVTGATGFIGRRLVKKLLERKGAVVHFLIRQESEDKVAGPRDSGTRIAGPSTRALALALQQVMRGIHF